MSCVLRYVKSYSTPRLLLGDASYDVSFFKHQTLDKYLMDVITLLEIMNKCRNFSYKKDSGQLFYFRMYERDRKHSAIKTFGKEQLLRSCFLGNQIMKKFVRTVVFQFINSSCL